MMDAMTIKFTSSSKWALVLLDVEGREVEVPLRAGLTFDGSGRVSGMSLLVQALAVRATAGEYPQTVPGPWVADLQMEPEVWDR